jgi:anti-sigma B factor antagonist
MLSQLFFTRIGERNYMNLKLDKGLHQGVDVIFISGEVDLYTASTLKEMIYELLDTGVSNIILDMTGLEFMDSSGLGVLVGTLKRVRSTDGSLWLICDRDNLLKVFRLTGLDKVFTIHASLEEWQPAD